MVAKRKSHGIYIKDGTECLKLYMLSTKKVTLFLYGKSKIFFFF